MCALGSFELATVLLLSRYNVIADFAKGITPSSNRKFLSQTASLATSKAATYLTSMVESAMQNCFTLLQLMAPPLRVNTNPEVDFLASYLIGNLSLCTQGVLDSLTSIPTYGL